MADGGRPAKRPRASRSGTASSSLAAKAGAAVHLARGASGSALSQTASPAAATSALWPRRASASAPVIGRVELAARLPRLVKASSPSVRLNAGARRSSSTTRRRLSSSAATGSGTDDAGSEAAAEEEDEEEEVEEAEEAEEEEEYETGQLPIFAGSVAASAYSSTGSSITSTGGGGGGSRGGRRGSDKQTRRRELNRVNAKRSRLRRKAFVETTLDKLQEVEADNTALRAALAEILGLNRTAASVMDTHALLRAAQDRLTRLPGLPVGTASDATIRPGGGASTSAPGSQAGGLAKQKARGARATAAGTATAVAAAAAAEAAASDAGAAHDAADVLSSMMSAQPATASSRAAASVAPRGGSAAASSAGTESLVTSPLMSGSASLGGWGTVLAGGSNTGSHSHSCGSGGGSNGGADSSAQQCRASGKLHYQLHAHGGFSTSGSGGSDFSGVTSSIVGSSASDRDSPPSPSAASRISSGSQRSGGSATQLSDMDMDAVARLSEGGECFFVTDRSLPDNPIVYASAALCELTGYAAHELVGCTIGFLQGPATDTAVLDYVARAMASGQTASTANAVVAYRKDGMPFAAHLSSSRLSGRAREEAEGPALTAAVALTAAAAAAGAAGMSGDTPTPSAAGSSTHVASGGAAGHSSPSSDAMVLTVRPQQLHQPMGVAVLLPTALTLAGRQQLPFHVHLPMAPVHIHALPVQQQLVTSQGGAAPGAPNQAAAQALHVRAPQQRPYAGALTPAAAAMMAAAGGGPQVGVRPSAVALGCGGAAAGAAAAAEAAAAAMSAASNGADPRVHATLIPLACGQQHLPLQ